jgi:ABC-2 type transport system permease protein
MLAIYKRELNSYYNTMIGYVFTAVFLVVSGFYFTQITLLRGSASITTVLSSISFIMILITPVLTMRLLAEERKSKTDQLLLTSPASVGAIVLSKFFAALTVVGVTLIITSVYPIIMVIFGNPYLGEILLGYFGFILLASCLIAVGIFISAITESQLTAAVASLGVMLMLWLPSTIMPYIEDATLRILLNAVSLYSYFTAYEYGILSLTSIVYYISFCSIFLFLTVLIVEKRRWI